MSILGTLGVIARYLGGQWEDPQPTALSFLAGETDELDGQWPRAGTARGGTAHRRGSKVHDEGHSWGPKANLMWPTPRLGGSNRNSRQAIVNVRGHPSGRSSVGLEQAVELALGVVPKEFVSFREMEGHSSASRYWPTPTTQDAKNDGPVSQQGRNSKPLNALVVLHPDGDEVEAGAPKTPAVDLVEPIHRRPLLNPVFVELLMGFGEGWTDV